MTSIYGCWVFASENANEWKFNWLLSLYFVFTSKQANCLVLFTTLEGFYYSTLQANVRMEIVQAIARLELDRVVCDGISFKAG